MPSINRNALVMYSVDEIFALINNVSAYPEFLPDCVDSKIVSQNDHSMKASLLVSKKGISKWFTTENTFVDKTQIKMTLVDGPFKQLTGCWQLTELAENACQINLNLNYEFSNVLMDIAFGGIFNKMANNMVQAFTVRAKEVYGSHVK